MSIKSVILCVGFLSIASSRADLIYYRAILNSAEIVPTAAALGLPASNASGIFNLTLDTVAETFTATAELNDMQGIYRPCFLPQSICSGAHLHLGALGAATPTHVFNTRDSDWTNAAGNQDPAAGNWSYSATNPFFINLSFSQVITELDTGNVYLNVHSDYMPTGEIRGQVYLVPEPRVTGFLLIGGLWTLFLRKHLFRLRLKSA